MKRITAILLTLLMLVMAAACTASPDKPADTTAAPSTTAPADTTAAPETTAPETEYQLPEKDMNNWELSILNTDPNTLSWANTTITVEDINGESLNDAFYNRNLALTQKYNFKLLETKQRFSDIDDTLSRNALSNNDEFDIYVLNEGYEITSIPYVTDFNYLPVIDLDQPWWNPNATSLFDINGVQIAVAGHMSLASASRAHTIVFNKDIWAERGDGTNFYDLVRDGKWTLDKYLEIAQSIASDLNGNQQWDKDDLYGMFFGRSFKGYLMAFSVGAGLGWTTANADGEHEFTLHQNENALNLLTRLIDSWQAEGFTYDISTTAYGTDTYLTCFEDGHALFTQRVPHDIINLRSMTQDFGILPNPKMDESQENYISPCYGGASWALSKTVSEDDYENLGIILEAMAYETYCDIMPLYIENAVKTRAGRDADSAEMLDIVYNTLKYDIAGNLLMNKMQYGWMAKVFNAKSSNILVSSITSDLNNYKKLIEDMYKAALDMD